MYDKYLPYEFHLRMVARVYEMFKYLLLPEENLFDSIETACWGHDLIEDCRVSYNDCVEHLGREVAEIIYAVTNNKGRNREERADAKFYYEMRFVPGATFVKLCDRIANIQYSKMTGSRMYDMYREEKGEFIKRIGIKYPDMLNYLINLFV